MGWFTRSDDDTVEVDSPLGPRLDAVAERLEKVTEQLENKLAEMRTEREGD